MYAYNCLELKDLNFPLCNIVCIKGLALYAMEKIKYIDVEHASFHGLHDVMYMTID
jgi:hypothetical protein